MINPPEYSEEKWCTLIYTSITSIKGISLLFLINEYLHMRALETLQIPLWYGVSQYLVVMEMMFYWKCRYATLSFNDWRLLPFQKEWSRYH